MHFLISWRNLWRHPRQTMIILSAVIIGVWAMVFFNAFVRGMAEDMINIQVMNLTGHIQVQAPGYHDDPGIERRIENPRDLLATIEKTLPDSALLTTRVRDNVVVRSPRETSGVTLVGIESTAEQNMSFLGSSLVEGSLPVKGENHIVLGAALARKLETRIGHRVVIDTVDASRSMISRAFNVVGLFRSTPEATEKKYAFVARDALQDMLGIGNGVTEINIMLADMSGVDKQVGLLRSALTGKSIGVLSWDELIPYLRAYLENIKIYAVIWNTVVFVAMASGLVNTMLMAVFERIREIGLVRALGVTPGGVVAGVLLETILLLVIGILLGDLLSYLTLSWLGSNGIDFSALSAGSDYFGMSRIIYPKGVAFDYLLANGMVIALGSIVSLYPAIKAARITPVQAMTHV